MKDVEGIAYGPDHGGTMLMNVARTCWHMRKAPMRTSSPTAPTCVGARRAVCDVGHAAPRQERWCPACHFTRPDWRGGVHAPGLVYVVRHAGIER
jgi:hypothetical protein